MQIFATSFLGFFIVVVIVAVVGSIDVFAAVAIRQTLVSFLGAERILTFLIFAFAPVAHTGIQMSGHYSVPNNTSRGYS